MEAQCLTWLLVHRAYLRGEHVQRDKVARREVQRGQNCNTTHSDFHVSSFCLSHRCCRLASMADSRNHRISILPSLNMCLASHPVIYKLFLIAVSSAFGFAPTTSPTFSPSLKSMNVGMARTESSCATSGTSSTSSL